MSELPWIRNVFVRCGFLWVFYSNLEVCCVVSFSFSSQVTCAPKSFFATVDLWLGFISAC